MKATVEKDKCISCGLCVETCPEVFEWDDNNLAQEKMQEIPPEYEDRVRESSENCPTDAIPLTE